jgi:WD40 repeat protein
MSTPQCRAWFHITAVLLWALCLPRPHLVQAQSPEDYPSTPILRPETMMHTAPINRIDVDREERFLVSGSDDKTVRIWDLSNGRLLRTLRVPLGEGSLGKVNAVAISPDGSTVAAGGYTGKYSGSVLMYIFDRTTGVLRHRVEGLPSSISHLAYAPDGRHLAAVFGGASGLRIYETGTYLEVTRDTQYGDSAYWAAFDASGRLVTTSLDGHVRLYDTAFQLHRKAPTPGGKQPYAAAFSPDGRSIAVGYADSTQVDILASQDLTRAYAANTTGVNSGNLATVAWSQDGRFLYAAGRYGVSGWSLLRRWDAAGKDVFVEWRVGTNAVKAIRPLAEGRLAIGTTDPLVAVLNMRGQVRWQQWRTIASFRNQWGARGLRVSHTGDVVQFGLERGGERPARLAVQEAQLTLDPPSDTSLAGPVTTVSGLTITAWQDTDHPTLNGKVLSLEPYETSRSLAISPDGQRFLLGTEWRLRLFDKDGTQHWRVVAPGTAWAVTIVPDGRTAIAGFGDGTLRWYRLQDGVELLAFFPHADGQRWVLWTPEGYYQASVGGEDLIGWHLNRGLDAAPEFYSASRFREQFHRPDVIARVLTTLDGAEALRLADQARGQQTRPRDIRTLLPPRVTILSPAPGTTTTSPQLTLFYKAESDIGPITATEVRVNGRPAQEQQHVKDPFQSVTQTHGVIGQFTVLVPPENATVDVIARNQHGASEPASFVSTWTGGPDWAKPTLYVLAIGVSHYKLTTTNLKWAARDAEDFAAAIKTQEGGLYKKVNVRVLPNDKATRQEIIEGLDWLLRETTSRDVAMVFLAGHGFRGDRNEYYFLPYEGDPDRPGATAVHDYNIRYFLSKVAGKALLFLDTCHSGQLRLGRGQTDALPDIAKFANELADADAGVIVFASSTGRERSLELDQFQHGAFTYALLEGIRGEADYTKDLFIVISELETYLAERVKVLTEGKQKPVTAKPEAVENYRVIRVQRGS